MQYQIFRDEQEIEINAIRDINKQIGDIDSSRNLFIKRTWKSKPLKIIQKITLFIMKLKYSSPTYRFKLLRRGIFELIRDKSAVFHYYLNNNLLHQQPSRLERVKYYLQARNSIWYRFWLFLKKDQTILLPADKILFVWDVLLMILTIINIFYVPLQLSFELDDEYIGNAALLFSTIPSCMFLIDLFLTFFKGFYHRGILHTSKSDIFWHYIYGEFILDLMVVLPFILSWFGFLAANYLMLLRITRVKRMLKNIEDIVNFQGKSAIAYQLFCLIYSLLLISHFCACLFHYVGHLEIEYGYEYTWLHAQHIVDADSVTKYINSLYWTSITSMTVGYGDVVPVTVPEKILVTIVTYLVTGLFGYALGMIQSIFTKMAEQQDQNQEKLRLITFHIRKRGLSPQLQFRVRKYFEYYLEFKQEEELDIDELMGHLNPKLKKEVQIEMYAHYLKKSYVIGNNLTHPIQKQLCLHIHERTFAPEEIIVSKNEVPDKFYILLTGHVQSYFKDHCIKRYKQDQMFCEREFFLQQPMSYDIKAKSFIQVAYISYTDFINIIQQDTKSYSLYRQYVDNNIYGHQHDQLICEVCQGSHQFNCCPLVFCKIQRDSVIAQYNISYPMGRKKFKRFRKYKFDKNTIRDRAFEQVMEQNPQINSRKLGTLGFLPIQFQNINHHVDSDSSKSLTTKLVKKKKKIDHDIGDLPYINMQIDQVTEYQHYNPDFNIQKVMIMLNRKSLYARIIDQIKKNKNKFASMISRQLLLRVL